MEEYKVSRIVAGEGHTLLLTAGRGRGRGKVFTWGKGLFGRLGNGSTTDQHLPTPLHIVETEENHTTAATIVDIAAGSYHSLALEDDGSVWSWGYNEIMDGQLGHQSSIEDSRPNPILCWGKINAETADDVNNEIVKEKPPKVISVAAGGMMSCAISEDGRLWMWGNCPSSVNEAGNNTPLSFVISICETPHPVAGLQELNVVKVACGYEHVVAMAVVPETEGCACYTWGGNKYGQLGLGDTKSRFSPQPVIALFGEDYAGDPSHVACGAFHTAVITEKGKHGRGSMCWTFGMGENGQLGLGNSRNSVFPQLVERLPEDERILSVSCGLFHMAIVTEAGEVWCWGMEQGLGLCPGVAAKGGDYLFPVRVVVQNPHDASSRCEEVACGAAHTIVLASNRCALFAWGRGQNGILGTGEVDDSPTPCRVIWPPLDTTSNKEDAVSPNIIDQLPKLGDPAEELAIAQKELSALKVELAAVKEQASALHAGLYGTLGSIYASAPTRAIFQEWDRMITAASYEELGQLDSFYRQARSRVKEVLLEKRVERLCKKLMGEAEGSARIG